MATSELIRRIDGWLAANRPVYYTRLRPGVNETSLLDFESRLGLKLPESFHALYLWKDGQEESCFESLHGNRMFMSLANIIETKQTLDGMIGTDFEEPSWWRRGWVPFLGNGGGDHLCLDLFAEDSGAAGQLIAFWHEDPDRPIEFPNLDAWLLQLADSMEGGNLEIL